MDRREFLTELFGAATISAIPTTVVALSLPTTQDWIDAIIKVHVRLFEDMFIYGTGAICDCKEFPFIRNVPLSELYLPPTTGGLFG